ASQAGGGKTEALPPARVISSPSDSRRSFPHRVPPPSDHMVEGDGAWASRPKEPEDESPDEVLGPGVRVDEALDGRDHPEERQRRQPAGETDNQQRGAAELETRRHRAGEIGC